MFKRKIYQNLLEWKHNHHSQVALLVEGARRIGKSTIVEEFAKKEYDDYIIFDFSKENDDVKNEFNTHISDLDRFFENIFVIKDKTLKSRNSLIIFDEVQMFPKARQAIKHLIKDNRFDYIETGSLISIKENVNDILIPSEEHRIRMYPMDFEEFLWATNDMNIANLIREHFIDKIPFDDSVHRKIMEKFRTYMCIGGMPQAINEYITKKNFDDVDFVKKEILNLYESDIKKHDKIDKGKASTIFRTLVEGINNNKSHFKFSQINKNARAQNYIDSLLFLEDTMMVNIAKNITDPTSVLNLYTDFSSIKIFYGDTGLYVSKAMANGYEDIYKSIIFNKSNSNLGSVYENVVAQMLVVNGNSLLFNKYKYKEKDSDKEKNYEIDFILRNGKTIIPIEVKSSNYNHHKSLDNFYKKFQLKNHQQIIIYANNLKIEGNILYIPLYMTMCL